MLIDNHMNMIVHLLRDTLRRLERMRQIYQPEHGNPSDYTSSYSNQVEGHDKSGVVVSRMTCVNFNRMYYYENDHSFFTHPTGIFTDVQPVNTLTQERGLSTRGSIGLDAWLKEMSDDSQTQENC